MQFSYSKKPKIDELYESGDIKIHRGSIEDIPAGWVLCDGENGTPNICDRAVVGAGRSYAKDEVFGDDSVTPVINVQNHSLSTSQMPHHQHAFQNGGIAGAGYATLGNGNGANPKTFGEGGGAAHKHGATANDVDTRQKSIALIWIMKL